jgi:hypothetical protein
MWCRELTRVLRRYANRIKNGTFQIDGTDYQVPKNEHNGLNTLHGGDIGYDGVSCLLVLLGAQSCIDTAWL